MTPHGFVDQPSALRPSYYRDIPAHGVQKILRSDEALFRAEAAPDRFEDNDIYPQHRFLCDSVEELERQRAVIDEANRVNKGMRHADSKGEARWAKANGRARWSEEQVAELKGRLKVGRLPDGDLCAVVHEFASLYYGAMGEEGDWRSMNETALLAVGVLIEETVSGLLGETGWIAFVEGEAWENEEVDVASAERAGNTSAAVRQAEKREKDSESGDDAVLTAETSQSDSAKEPTKKRRTIALEGARYGEDF